MFKPCDQLTFHRNQMRLLLHALKMVMQDLFLLCEAFGVIVVRRQILIHRLLMHLIFHVMDLLHLLSGHVWSRA
jgi:hypothetical protein